MRSAAILVLALACTPNRPPESCAELVRCDQAIDDWQSKASNPPSVLDAENLAMLVAVCRERVRTQCGGQ